MDAKKAFYGRRKTFKSTVSVEQQGSLVFSKCILLFFLLISQRKIFISCGKAGNLSESSRFEDLKA